VCGNRDHSAISETSAKLSQLLILYVADDYLILSSSATGILRTAALKSQRRLSDPALKQRRLKEGKTTMTREQKLKRLKKLREQFFAAKTKQEELAENSFCEPPERKPLILFPGEQPNHWSPSPPKKNKRTAERNKITYHKKLPVNEDGTVDPITILTSICQIGSRLGFFPAVGILRAMEVKRGSIVDTQIISYEGRLGLLITAADLKTDAGPGIVQKKVVAKTHDRCCVPIAQAHIDQLEFKQKDEVCVLFIPQKGRGKDREGPYMFVYKDEMAESGKRKKSLWQVASEAMAKLKAQYYGPSEERMKKHQKNLEGLDWLAK